MGAASRAQDRALNVLGRHGRDRRQECPLIRVWTQTGVDEHAATLFSRPLLQRQGNQIAETTLRHRALIGKEPVVGIELQLPGARACVADDRRAQAACVARRDLASEEDPRMGTMTGARDFKRNRYAQLLAGHCEGPGIVLPLGLVEVDREEVAGVVLQ
jgi:hypothetical protein